jgi:cytochrome P450
VPRRSSASPPGTGRRPAICDTELAGQKIAEGDKVVMFYTSANRDEDVFAAPQEFDIGRDPNPAGHVTRACADSSGLGRNK